MKLKRMIITGLGLSLLMLVLSACGLLQEVEEPTSTLVAPTIAAPAGQDTAAEEPEAEEEDMAEAVTTTEEGTTAEDPAPAGDTKTYTIDPTASQARFELDEELRGQPLTVVGVTDQIAGQIALNLSDLSTAQIGQILINARTLSTDNNFRNRAINNEILDTGQYEFVTFSPTAINGLPASAAVGDEITFSIDGDLTIRDVTNPVTFNVTATVVSENQISGTASTVINRADYGLTIPSVPNVANVEEEVELYLDFVANAA